ncbi:MAG: GTPase Obg [Nannocystaceae bacterium]
MRFVDQVRIVVRAGRGGDGAVAWRREAKVPKGGPAGGDGGHGGDIVLEADPHLSTLLDLHYRRIVRADDGRPGGTRDRNGRGAEDLIIKVPVGTSVYLEGHADDPEPSAEGDEGGMDNVYVGQDREALERLEHARLEMADDDTAEPDPFDPEVSDAVAAMIAAETEAEATDLDDAEDDEPFDGLLPAGASEVVLGELLGDLTEPNRQLVVARGGRGGRGNIHFRSATNRAPDTSEPGQEGEAWRLRLELKLLADVGIVGFPNVGKSTLIRRISRARPKVGSYPFTTLVPNLGVVALSGGRSMVVADVPGLIRGASDGKGLGHQFLRHLERTRVLLHLLAPDYGEDREPLADLDVLERELERYGSQFDGRPRVVALNKLDLLGHPEGRALVAATRAALRERNIPLFMISAETGAGIPKLLEALWRRLGRVPDGPE